MRGGDFEINTRPHLGPKYVKKKLHLKDYQKNKVSGGYSGENIVR